MEWVALISFSTMCVCFIILAKKEIEITKLEKENRELKWDITCLEDNISVLRYDLNHYQYKFEQELRKNKIRVELDNRNEKLGYRMRESQTMKVPFTLVLGDQERDNETVTYRLHGKQETTTVALDEFIELVKEVIDTKAMLK